MKSRSWVFLLVGFALPCLYAENGAAMRASPQISAAISAGLPRFDQVPIATPHREEPFDRIALPPFVVEGIRVPKISPPELLTKAGMESLLRQRYPGASFRGQEPTMNGQVANYAALMYRDDLRFSRMAEMERLLAATSKTGDLTETKELEAELQKTFMRGHDWRTEGMDKSVNHWRR